MITVQNLTRDYGDFRAVNNISFTVNQGEITGLLGPNGAGKTTTLRMLTCYLRPTEGSITINGVDAAADTLAVRRLMGYLPEAAPVYNDMIVFDYLRYAADMRGIANIAERIDAVAAQCGIVDVMHKSVNELSKGYRQRVGLAQAIIHDPEILILDEPTSGLDPNQIIEIRRLIREIGKRKTVILSTHILSEAEAACDRIIIINKGTIAADDSTEAIRAGGGTTVTVKIVGADFAAFNAALANIKGVASAEQLHNEDLTAAKITAEVGIDIRPSIFNLIKEQGWTLYELHREEQSLESIFRRLTTGGEA